MEYFFADTVSPLLGGFECNDILINLNSPAVLSPRSRNGT